MASAQKISELTTAGPLTGAELVPIVQNGGTLQTTVSVVAAFAVVSLVPVVSALGTQIANVSAQTSANSAAITSTNAVLGALEVRVSSVSAVAASNTAAITSINAVTSALDARVSVLEAAVSAIGDVSAIATLVSTVAILDAEVSALDIRLTAVSAATSVNAAAITSINAVVSTKVNRVGDFMDSVQYIEFDTPTIVSSSAGRLSWSIEEGTLDIGLDNQGVVLHAGLQLYQRVYNDTAATLAKGTVIRVTGSQGQRLTAAPALANSDANSATTFAVMAENVSVNNSGFAITEGVLKNINTSGIADGATLWLSPTSAGEYTPTKPTAPQHLVLVGFVVKGNSTSGGSIYVKIINGFELGELHDVKVSSSTSLANGEVLAYDTSAGVWTNSMALINAEASISALNVQMAAVSALTSVNAAAITSTNNVVSALEIRVSAASAAGVTNAAAITSINDVVSALEVRVSAVSATAVTNAAAITSINNVVSAVQAQVNAVSVSVGQRVLKAGDTMTGALTISTSADAQSLTVNGFGTFTSRVSISAGFYTGLQNYQDHTVQRATFRDYALVLVARGSVSATTTLDLTEGNFFAARIAGSTTFVFANPPVSVTGASGGAAGGFVLELQNGGAATVTWPAAVDWPGGTAPTLTSSGFDVFVFITDDGGTIWRGVQSMRDSK